MKKRHLLLMIIPLVWSANKLDAQQTTLKETVSKAQITDELLASLCGFAKLQIHPNDSS